MVDCGQEWMTVGSGAKVVSIFWFINGLFWLTFGYSSATIQQKLTTIIHDLTSFFDGLN